MSILIDGGGGREAISMQCLHECVFTQGGQAGHVEPGGGFPVLEVVALVFDGPEGDAAEAMEFEDDLVPGLGLRDVDVGFFAHADFLTDLIRNRSDVRESLFA